MCVACQVLLLARLLDTNISNLFRNVKTFSTLFSLFMLIYIHSK